MGILDLEIHGQVASRCDSCDVNGVGGGLGGGSLVQNVWVRHTKCGAWVNGPLQGLHLVGLDVRNTNADGVNLHGGATDTTVEHSRFRNTGDDGVALWSDRSAGGADANVTIQCAAD